MNASAADHESLELRQIIADIDLKRADAQRKIQEMRLAPWQLVVTALSTGGALFAAGAAFMKFLETASR